MKKTLDDFGSPPKHNEEHEGGKHGNKCLVTRG